MENEGTFGIVVASEICIFELKNTYRCTLSRREGVKMVFVLQYLDYNPEMKN